MLNVDIGIARNEWYGRNDYKFPMYLLSLAWKLIIWHMKKNNKK